MRKATSFPVVVLIIFLFSGFIPTRQKTNEINLLDEVIPVIPKEFYIADVVDERDNRTAIAWLFPANGITDVRTLPVAVDFHGGTANAIKRFIQNNLKTNKALRPIIIRIKKFKATEVSINKRTYKGQITLYLSFDLAAADTTIRLTNYVGNASYTRSAGPPQSIEPTLRHLVENGLVSTNEWINQQVGTNISLAHGVSVRFSDFVEKLEGDSIYYSVKRPLTWNDFQAAVPVSKYDAEVFSSFGYNEETKVLNGIVNIHLSLKVCLQKSSCWAKPGARNPYTLNHEQRHFDIAKIIAEKFKKKVISETFIPLNYDAPINMDYLDASREAHALQKLYDDETAHGVNHIMQQKWNERIDKYLAEFGIKR